MIHGGTIRTGCAYTVEVWAAYSISSINRLRNTTLPGVTATPIPGRNRSGTAGVAPRLSAQNLRMPAIRLAPCDKYVASRATGLVNRKFDGANISRAWRMANVQ